MAGIDELGFLPGWGNTVGRVRESFQLLLDIVQVGLPGWLAGLGHGCPAAGGLGQAAREQAAPIPLPCPPP